MDASVDWINVYLDRPADADEQGELLTMAGFPLEGREEISLPDGSTDICQDFEMTSNRGDCVCHVGLAREIAAISGRTLKLPAPDNQATAQSVASEVKVTNHEPDKCPIYTARIIKNVTVGPSPEWLANRLRAIGQIPRNCIVDATNYVLFELGQPTHVFDLSTIRGNEVIIRMAKPDEPFLPIGEGEREIKLRESDLVIADAERAIALGGVKGGALTAVSDKTTGILIEAATFDPVTVRNTSRAHKIDSASSYRYERGVHPAHVNPAAERLVELILQVAGGDLHEGSASDGAAMPAIPIVSMRPDRCRQLLGVDIADEQMVDSLQRLGFDPILNDDTIICTPPPHRLDIEREVDLIEEVSRMFGHENIPIADSLSIRVQPPQPRELARRAVSHLLIGMGCVECVTHSLIAEKEAQAFLEEGERFMRLDDERTRAEPILRPSLVPSLLRVKRHNQDNGIEQLTTFEWASIFAEGKVGHREERSLTIVGDVDVKRHGLRPMRGMIERIIREFIGHDADVSLVPIQKTKWLEPATQAEVVVNRKTIGRVGLLEESVQKQFDLNGTIAAAELDLEEFMETYPHDQQVRDLPAFPAIDRDLSIIVAESTPWQAIEQSVRKLDLVMLESIEFITTFRGKQIEAGKKSVTMRLRFRSKDRTLTHDEVDPQMTAAIEALEKRVDGEVRR